MAWLDDLRLAARSLVRTPALLSILVLSVAVGIGSNVVVHGFARGLAVDEENAQESATLGFEQPEAMQRLDTLLGIGAGLVLVIALGNVASLLLGRSATRAPVTAMRLALGAGRARLVRGVIAESVIVAVIGAAFGTLVATWLASLLPALVFVEDGRRLNFVPDRFGMTTLAFVCAVLTVPSGLAPVLAIARAMPAEVLRRESAGASPLMTRIRQGLLIVQLGCCCALVSSAGLIVERLAAASKTDVARGLGDAVLATVNADPNVGLRYFEEIEQVATAGPPPLRALAWTATLPGTKPTLRTYRAEPPGLASRTVQVGTSVMTPDLLRQLSLPPLAGRLFGLADGNCRVAVANEQAARLLFDARSVGRTVEEPSGELVEIIGVVRERPDGVGAVVGPKLFYADTESARPEGTRPMRLRTSVPTTLVSIELDTRIVSPGYFDAMAATVIAGQLTRGERGSACRIGVVNQQTADRYFAGNAIGGALIDESGRRTEIVGIVRTSAVGAFERSVEPAVFLPMAQDWVPQMTVILGGPQVTPTMMAGLQERLQAVPGRGRAPPSVKSLETYLRETALAPLRVAMAIVGVFAATAVVLSVIGLYGALADAARRRHRELAIRVALGARRFDVLRLILGEGSRLLAAGCAAGIGGAWLLSQQLAAVTPGDAAPFGSTWLAGPLVVALAVLGASALPARRGAMIDPVVALRDSR